ncbi:MAG: M20/M25/M40 family metallo-hydrolase, partial [Cytophagaceae bacterium]
ESLFINLEDHPDMKEQFGNDIITASGTTLLGADNKAGMTAIMEAAQFLMQNDVPHGEIKILFTPDEEIGRGVDQVNLVKLGADFGYTIDGETLGSIEDETFSADGATITVRGKSAHPGFAKGQMESALKIISEIIAAIPRELSPENTADEEGFIHPVEVSGTVEYAEAKFILRDFNNEKLKDHGLTLESIANKVFEKYPSSTYVLEIHEQYTQTVQP